MNEIIESCDFILKRLNLDLLVGGCLGKLMVFLDLSLEFLAEFVDGLLEFIHEYFFFTDKFQIKEFGKFNFHSLMILRDDFELSCLKTIFE